VTLFDNKQLDIKIYIAKAFVFFLNCPHLRRTKLYIEKPVVVICRTLLTAIVVKEKLDFKKNELQGNAYF
jgi:hypothetical protein